MIYQFKKPTIGNHIKVVLQNQFLGEMSINVPLTITLSGQVISSENFDDPASFRLLTNNPNHPISVISLDHVKDLKYDTGQEGGKEKIKTIKSRIWKMPNSKKTDSYTVTYADGNWNCDCKGWSFRKNCRHVNSAKQELEDERK